MSHQYPLMNLGFFFSVSSSFGRAKQLALMTSSCYQKEASCVLHLFLPLSKHSNLMHLCIGLHPFLSLTFLREEKSRHCLVLTTLFLLIIVEEHHCKMYKKRVVVHYSIPYHPKSVLQKVMFYFFIRQHSFSLNSSFGQLRISTFIRIAGSWLLGKTWK